MGKKDIKTITSFRFPSISYSPGEFTFLLKIIIINLHFFLCVFDEIRITEVPNLLILQSYILFSTDAVLKGNNEGKVKF